MASRLGRWRADYAGTACPRCRTPWRHETLQTGTHACPRCGREAEVARFDPPEAPSAVPASTALAPGETAPCARHARNLAVAACQRCGQFICALCEIQADGKTVCPSCFDRLSTEGALASTVTRYKNYAGMADCCFLILGLAFPLGIYYCIRGLRDKKSRNESDGVPGLYVRAVLFILVGLLMTVSIIIAILK